MLFRSRNLGVQQYAVLQVFVELVLALDDNDGADPLGCQLENSFADNGQRRIALLVIASDQLTQQAESVKCLADFILKYHHHQYDQNGFQLLQHPAGHLQAGQTGQKKEGDNHSKACQYLDSTATAKPAVELVHQKAHDEDVKYVLGADCKHGRWDSAGME